MKTLAILTSNFPPTNIVGALRPFRLAKHISRKNWQVVIITCPPKEGIQLDHSLLKRLNTNCKIVYIPRPSFKRCFDYKAIARVMGTGRDILKKWIIPDLEVFYILAYYHTFRKLKHVYPVDVMLTTSPPHSLHIAGLLIQHHYRLPWVVDFRDPWDDYLKSGNSVLNHPVERRLEKDILHQAEAIISTTKTYTRQLSIRHKYLSAEKFYTITNTYDPNDTSRPAIKSKNKFVLCHTGIFYPDKDPYGFFRALHNWFASMNADDRHHYRQKIEVHLIGSGDPVTRRMVRNLELTDNVVFFDRMSHPQAIQKTLQADMGLICTGTGERTRAGWLPSKFFEYLGCRIPILAIIKEGELATIIEETESGHAVTSENHALITEIIKANVDHKFTRQGQHQTDSHYRFSGVEIFKEPYVMNQFIELLEKVLSSK